jgi:hypothetical protein
MLTIISGEGAEFLGGGFIKNHYYFAPHAAIQRIT